MYIRKDVEQHVIKLFKEQPKYRDDRIGTVQYIVNIYKGDDFVNSRDTTFYKLIFDIDRAFRGVQQDHPELRGETWLERQVMAGELAREVLDEMEKRYTQLSLKFEE